MRIMIAATQRNSVDCHIHFKNSLQLKWLNRYFSPGILLLWYASHGSYENIARLNHALHYVNHCVESCACTCSWSINIVLASLELACFLLCQTTYLIYHRYWYVIEFAPLPPSNKKEKFSTELNGKCRKTKSRLARPSMNTVGGRN